MSCCWVCTSDWTDRAAYLDYSTYFTHSSENNLRKQIIYKICSQFKTINYILYVFITTPKSENIIRKIHRNIHTYSPVHIKNGNWCLYELAVLKLWIKSGRSRNCPNWDSLMLNYSLQKPDFTVTSHNSYLRYLCNGKLILNVDKQFVAFFVKKKIFFFDRSIFIIP